MHDPHVDYAGAARNANLVLSLGPENIAHLDDAAARWLGSRLESASFSTYQTYKVPKEKKRTYLLIEALAEYILT